MESDHKKKIGMVQFIVLALRQTDACLTLFFNTVKENLRGWKESKNDTHSDFLILDDWIDNLKGWNSLFLE